MYPGLNEEAYMVQEASLHPTAVVAGVAKVTWVFCVGGACCRQILVKSSWIGRLNVWGCASPYPT